MKGPVDNWFGSNVFNQDQMEKYLPQSVLKQLQAVMDSSAPLPAELAEVTANAMKDWALDKGATHYTHWFQPMTGITAEKHDAFINPKGSCRVISGFKGKELVKGEPDASSFPSGGLRATFEARGYTAWDPTGYAFVKDKTLYIPTLFCSYDGSALDKKTPLLRSLDALDHEACRILRLMGYDVSKVQTQAGAEQEYFLVDAKTASRRLDLMVTGRTLFGRPPVKGQELDDHYFGSIPARVKAFMEQVDEELWKLGVYAKTEHKEVAPGQFELAPVYTRTNLANDQNQLVMEVLQRVAKQHGLLVLLHEKPFAGINGSGKHNNWSLSTDDGENLLEPGDSPQDNLRFLVFLAAILKGVDEYQDLLRISVASAGNDHRLGADEAPPAIISMYLGEELTAILEAVEENRPYVDRTERHLQLGVNTLPDFPKDSTDRNRTSPFAFTGNKFEFRMPGSNLNISCPNTILNTIVAEELSRFSDVLEMTGKEDRDQTLLELVRTTVQEHKRILFSGNGYSQAWKEEAKRRGLHELKTAADALPHYTDPENLALFAKHKVYQAHELYARQTILLENYCQVVTIEARTMPDMLQKEILPAISRYEGMLAKTALDMQGLGMRPTLQTGLLDVLEGHVDRMLEQAGQLQDRLDSMPEQVQEAAEFCAENLLPGMDALRKEADEVEGIVPRDVWPLPDYNEMLLLGL